MANNAGSVDSMMYAGKTPWHSFGEAAKEAPSAEDAIKLAGLDWRVEAVPVYYGEEGKLTQAPNTFATRRTDNNGLLGVVSNRYKIFQNRASFGMIDALLDMGAKIETAGSLDEGRKIWVLAKMEPWRLLGDEIDSYLFLANHHDGKGSLVAGATNVRIVCQNTFDLAIKSASRKWAIRHMGADLNTRLVEATKTLELNNMYRDALTVNAEMLATKKLTDNEFTEFLNKLIPFTSEDSDCVKNRAISAQENVRMLSAVDNLDNFKNTAWGAFQAVADYAYHTTPNRLTETYAQNQMKWAIDGHPLVQTAFDMLSA
jgi:phage/plasmid-like protein (TIGR03299 family)